ncbi:SLBB domain-containing protein [Undibacterium sp. CY7W]|uniref:SLBB domain-containing protein n=3 Tax=Undibacterium TaxID=401469 RepID=A0A923I3M3_9BURK|nr:SLBB domain-containing protein [Undibacterium rugosum]MBC3937133.1 SLBB domain-containing protein [Undibacterium rugosum]
MKSTLPVIALLAASSTFAQQVDVQTADVQSLTAKQPRITNQSLTQLPSKPAVDEVPLRVENRSTEKTEASEFQQFVRYATGKSLPVFGADFFQNTPSSFAPLQNTPVPSEYMLGAGDELLIRAWGSLDVDYRAVVDRNGVISIPTIGNINLAGVKAADAEAIIRSSIAKLYRDVTVNVSFGRLRAITVYVVGQAKKPGSYTVSGFSTLVTAMLVSGGPNAAGSMRNVQVKRNGKVLGNLDLYAFIAKGDKSSDIKLQDGDTIFIPAAVGHIALTGKVNTPAIYELKTANESISSILDLAGGMPVVADPRRAFLERIDANKSQPRTVEEFALNGAGLSKSLKNGDLLTVTAITPDFANAVTLRGNVNQALRVPFKSGMRIRDLIPNRESLITRASVQRQNDILLQQSVDGQDARKENAISLSARIGNLFDDVNWDYAVIERIDRATLNVTLIPFHLGRALEAGNTEDNLQLQAGDAVTVFSQNDIRVPVAKRKVFARIEGEVNVPGVYQMMPGETLQSLVAKAGGATSNAYLFGTEFYRDKVRAEQQVNLEKTVRRLESQLRAESAKVAANQSGSDAQLAALKAKSEQESGMQALARMRELKATGRVSLDLSANDENVDKLPQLKLENGDQLIIPSRPDFVHIFGAVNQEASVIWRKGTTVDKYLANAGVTSEADLDGIFVLRANGTVLSSTGRGWFSSVSSAEVMPGDSIVVPERLNKETAYKSVINGLKDWAQILSGFGISAAAIKSLRQ